MSHTNVGVAICHHRNLPERENLRAHRKLLLRLCYNNSKHSGDFIIRERRTRSPRLVITYSKELLPTAWLCLKLWYCCTRSLPDRSRTHPAEHPKGVFRIRGAGYRNASKVAYGRDYQDGVGVLWQREDASQLCHRQADLASQRIQLQAGDGLDNVGLYLEGGTDEELGIVDR